MDLLEDFVGLYNSSDFTDETSEEVVEKVINGFIDLLEDSKGIKMTAIVEDTNPDNDEAPIKLEVYYGDSIIMKEHYDKGCIYKVYLQVGDSIVKLMDSLYFNLLLENENFRTVVEHKMPIISDDFFDGNALFKIIDKQVIIDFFFLKLLDSVLNTDRFLESVRILSENEITDIFKDLEDGTFLLNIDEELGVELFTLDGRFIDNVEHEQFKN